MFIALFVWKLHFRKFSEPRKKYEHIKDIISLTLYPFFTVLLNISHTMRNHLSAFGFYASFFV